MNLIRRSAWVAVLAGAVAGCSEEGATDTTKAPPPTPALAPSGPMAPADTKNEPAKAEPAKVEPAKEAPKEAPPAAKPGEAKKADEASPKLEGPKAEGGKGDTAAVQLTPSEIATIRQLPAADQEIALKQAVCPVSDGHLGSEDMGKPYKVTVEGRTVFLCCDGCEKELKADPKKFLAKLDAQAKK